MYLRNMKLLLSYKLQIQTFFLLEPLLEAEKATLYIAEFCININIIPFDICYVRECYERGSVQC